MNNTPIQNHCLRGKKRHFLRELGTVCAHLESRIPPSKSLGSIKKSHPRGSLFHSYFFLFHNFYMLYGKDCLYLGTNRVIFLDFRKAFVFHDCFVEGVEQRADSFTGIH